MKNENRVLACVDQSRFADDVADCAAWAARCMQAPLEFLHVIDRHPERSAGDDHSGTIGIDAQETLLDKLSAEDEARSRAARDQGRIFLNRLRERAIAAGAPQVDTRQRHGELEETLQEQAAEVRLIVLGRKGRDAETRAHALGRNVERVVRALHKPVLTVPEGFREPRRIMIAFDGSAITRRGVSMVAQSPLFQGLPIHLLMCGKKQSQETDRQLDWARNTLAGAGFQVEAEFIAGKAENLIAQAIQRQSIDMLVMGSFGHSFLRSLLFGSKTTALLRASNIPTLLLR